MGQSAWARIAAVMPQPFEVVPNKNNHQKIQVPYYKPKTVWNIFSPCSLILNANFHCSFETVCSDKHWNHLKQYLFETLPLHRYCLQIVYSWHGPWPFAHSVVLEWGPLPRWHRRSFGFGENLKMSCWWKIQAVISLALFFAFSSLTWWPWLCYHNRVHYMPKSH